MRQPPQPCDPRYLRNLLRRHGFYTSKRLGQHFLTDARIPTTITRRAEIDKTQGVLEIGPGAGALTRALSTEAGRVVAVEADPALLPVLEETLHGLGNVTVIPGDILKVDLRALARERLAPYVPVVCANLPYHITTPVLTCLLEADVFQGITVMVQREVARRICARPGTPEYGAFTLYAGARASREILFDVPAGSFTPPPKVTSSVVSLRRQIYPLRAPDLFARVVRAAFGQRRKTLLNALVGSFPLTKTEIADVLRSCGLSPMVRGEVLDIAEFDALSHAIHKII